MSARAELLLFLADRAQHVDEVIRPALERGECVLCDRFNDSTRAYQGGARGFPEELLKIFCTFASDGLEPDLTLYLDVDPEVALRRLPQTADRIEAESLLFHQNIRRAFHRIAQLEPIRVRMINADAPPDQVFAAALELIDGS